MKIDLLYFDGCPSWQNGLDNLRIALNEEGLDTSINLVEVSADQQVSETSFLGSPSFQFNGLDFWPEERSAYALSCRVYKTAQGLKGWPTVAMLRLKLQEITQNKDSKK